MLSNAASIAEREGLEVDYLVTEHIRGNNTPRCGQTTQSSRRVNPHGGDPAEKGQVLTPVEECTGEKDGPEEMERTKAYGQQLIQHQVNGEKERERGKEEKRERERGRGGHAGTAFTEVVPFIVLISTCPRPVSPSTGDTALDRRFESCLGPSLREMVICVVNTWSMYYEKGGYGL